MFLCFLNKWALSAAAMSEAINAKTVVFVLGIIFTLTDSMQQCMWFRFCTKLTKTETETYEMLKTTFL